MTGKIILILILILLVLIVVVVMAGFIVLFLAYGDQDHENSVNVPRGTTMGTTRTTNISRTGKK